MDYIEAAALLGQAILESGEFQHFKEAEAAMAADERAQTLMQEYKELQGEMVRASRENLGKEQLEAVRDTLLARQQELNGYEITRQYFAARQDFDRMMRSVNGVLEHFLTGGQSGGCSGSCETCGGCG